MNDNSAENQAIRRFVRESLGCSCPEEVFDSIRINDQPGLFEQAHTVYEIGGRLFVAVVAADDWQAVYSGLGRMVDTGRDYRDQHGYNRFRLVIATDDVEARSVLEQQFAALPNTDEKTHLHVVSPQQLP
jgi:hypothetical protein